MITKVFYSKRLPNTSFFFPKCFIFGLCKEVKYYKKENKMAFSVKSKKSGKTYYLHSKEVKLAGGRKQRIFYFAGEEAKNSIDELPTGYEVMENKRTGLPMLRKKKK